jgi:DNA uptake protein ComE-like DNA-binding protein
MLKPILSQSLASILVLGLGTGVVGCNWNVPDSGPHSGQNEQQQRDEKTREEAAKATEHMKPAIEEAGKELGAAARRAAEEARAAAQGVQEGWTRDAHEPIDLNSASVAELTELPGISAAEARRIIGGRPYRDKRDLLVKGILSDASYSKIRDLVVVR